MRVIIGDDGKESYRMDGSAKLSYQIGSDMTNVPTATPSEKVTKPRGPRVFSGKSFSLVFDFESEAYQLAFEGRQFPVRFQSPTLANGLIDPLAGGMLHKSGRHNFKLSFTGSVLTSIVNLDQDRAEGEATKRTESVNVPFDSELAKWIKVSVETDVVTALRIK